MPPETMKGLIFAGKGKAVLREEETPQVASGKLLCQTVYSGLTNGTERTFLVGGNYGSRRWPNRCGYQNVGRVLEVGEGVQGFQKGDVLFSAEFCQHVQFFATPAGPENLLTKLPEKVDLRQAALLGVVSVALHDVRRADVGLGDRALVVGAGLIGQFSAQCARAAGAQVTIVDTNEKRLDIAKECGAHKTAVIRGDETWAQLKAEGPYDVVFENSGAPVLDHVIGANWGMGLVKHRGVVVMIAGRDRVDYGFNAAQGAELAVLHAGHFVRSDLLEAVRLVAEGVLRVGPMIQECVPYTEAVGIYDRLRDNPGSLFGTVFDWTEGARP